MKRKSFFKKINIFIYHNLNKFVNTKYCSSFLYRVYFITLSYLRKRSRIQLSIEKDFFLIYEEINKFEKIQWAFPNSLRLRCLINYHNGLKNRGYKLSNDYSIDKIKFNNNDIIIDCGSNLSDLLLYLGSLNLKLSYHSIEPGKEEAITNKLNLKNENFSKINKHFHEFALAERNELKTFYYAPQNANSSLVFSDDYKLTYKVKSITLDRFSEIAKLSNKNIKLLKLEAEGLEPEILKGSKKFLKNIEYIAADLGPERGINKECTLAEVTAILTKNNFEMLDFNYPRITALFHNKLF